MLNGVAKSRSIKHTKRNTISISITQQRRRPTIELSQIILSVDE
jgi:hypothetical protein